MNTKAENTPLDSPSGSEKSVSAFKDAQDLLVMFQDLNAQAKEWFLQGALMLVGKPMPRRVSQNGKAPRSFSRSSQQDMNAHMAKIRALRTPQKTLAGFNMTGDPPAPYEPKEGERFMQIQIGAKGKRSIYGSVYSVSKVDNEFVMLQSVTSENKIRAVQRNRFALWFRNDIGHATYGWKRDE